MYVNYYAKMLNRCCFWWKIKHISQFNASYHQQVSHVRLFKTNCNCKFALNETKVTQNIKEESIQPRENENAGLTEIITVYERMTKGRPEDASVFRISKHFLPGKVETHDDMAEETMPLIPSFLQQQVKEIPGHEKHANSQAETFKIASAAQAIKTNVLDFNKYQNLHLLKYNFFSPTTNLIQADNLEGLSVNYVELLKSKYYWLNITNPNEVDLNMLSSSFSVHDLTLQDIRSENSEEKIEIFKHYTFISLKLLGSTSLSDSESENSAFTAAAAAHDHVQHEESNQNAGNESNNNDFDFNILLFKDFVITMHDKPWSSIHDILGFLNLLCLSQENSTKTANKQQGIMLTPDWILFSIFIELKQDAKFLIDNIEPEINHIRLGSKSGLHEMSEVMKAIFDMEFQIYTLSKFIKPKMNILRTLEAKCDKRLNKAALKLITDIHDDFKDMSHEMEVASHILERSQDTVLGLVNVEKTKEQTEASKVMNRLSQIALVFLPIQACAGFFGMNVTVPFQNETGTLYFWLIVSGSTTLAFIAFALRTVILTRTFWKPKSVKAMQNVEKGNIRTTKRKI